METITTLLTDRVAAGSLPGAVAARWSDQRCDTCAVGDESPDSVFFWDSVTKPVTAAVALTFIADGSLATGTPVSRWLPELAAPRVLRSTGGSPACPDDTVACEREVTVGDLLTLRGGLGFVPDFDGPYNQALVRELREGQPRTTGRDGFLAAAATLPLAHQPGAGWTYNTGSTLLGLLLERVAGRSLAEITRDRILVPLGMRGTTWSAAPFPDGAGGLSGPVQDWMRFGRMLLGGGELDGARVLPERLVAAMTTDHLTAEQRSSAGFFLEDGEGWGYGGSVRADGSYGWAGAAGTYARVDMRRGEVLVLFTRLALDGPGGSELLTDVERAWAQESASE